MSDIFLFIVAILPAFILCRYVFKMDKVEKEPLGLLIKLLVLGAVSCFPAASVEVFLDGIIDTLFYNNVGTYSYLFIKNFIGIALVEEGFKLIILLIFTRKNKEFNCLFDGIIYSVFVSLGFAALENVLYVFEYGLWTAIMRAVLAVPGHMFFAVMMGYYYSMWHITDKTVLEECKLKKEGIISNSKENYNPKRNIIKCILIPVLAHGFYDFCCTVDSTFFMLVLLVFVMFMYSHCFSKIKRMSKSDNFESNYVQYLLKKKYPEYREYLQREKAEVNF